MSGYEAQFIPPFQEEEEEFNVHRSYPDHFGVLLYELATRITGREGSEAILGRDETDELMFRIIAGEDAQQQINTAGPNEVRGRCVQSGLVARKQMLEGTARLGRRLGINSMGYQLDDTWKPTGHRPGLGGGLAKIANLGSPYADVEDRIQSALAGMPIALRRYAKSFRKALAAEDPEEALAALPGFSTLVMFASREMIYLHMSTPTIREPMGVRIKYKDLARIRAARRQYSLFDLSLVTRDQVTTREEYQELQEVRDMIEASQHVPWDDIIFPSGAPEETSHNELDEPGEEIPIFAPYEFESEPPAPLYLEEVYPDPHWRDGFTAVETALTWLDPKRGFLYGTSHLTDHESRESRHQQTALALFCGFPLKGFLPDTHNFPEIAKLLGVKTPQSIYRSKKSALSKITRNGRAMALLENLSWVNGDEGTVARAFTGNRIRTGHRVLKSADRPSVASVEPTPQWARRVLSLSPEADASQRGTPDYEEVFRSLTKGIFSALEELSVSAEEAKRSPYPKTLYGQIETHIGKRVTVKHIEDFWNNQAGPLLSLQREGGTPVNANRLGQLTSKLLASRLQPDDKVTLYIPRDRDGQCGYMGAWISQGEVKIVGNAGDYVGFGMSGSGTISVVGSVGDYAGAYGSDRSFLNINESAGRQAGYRLRHRSSVRIRENARLPVATGIRDAGFVQIGEFNWGNPEVPDTAATEAGSPTAPGDKQSKPIALGPALFLPSPVEKDIRAKRPMSDTLPPKKASSRAWRPVAAPTQSHQPSRPLPPQKPYATSSLSRQPDDTPPPLWAHHVQDLKAQGSRLRPNTRSYKLVGEALKEAVISNIDQLTMPDDVTDTHPYPEMYNDITRYLGAYLTSQHIEGFWNREVPHLIGDRRWNRKLQLNPNRLGQLMSKLLADRLEEDEHIKLVIPEGIEGQCGYLGAWATRGVITIIGEAGNYTGAYLSGTALVVVEGDVGDYAGMEAHGESYVIVDGQAGNFLGYKAHEMSTIAVQEAAGESVAVAIADQANVVVEDREWLPSYGIASRPIRPGGVYEEDNQEEEPETTPVAEAVTEPEEAPGPVRESGLKSAETPPLETQAVTTEEEVMPAAPVEAPSATPTPSTSPSPSHQSSVQTIDFDDAVYYLHLDGPDALQEYTDQIGHEGRETLTAEELAELRRRFPEL